MRRFLALAAFASLAFACSDSTSPAAAHVGVYNLQTLNGAGLPQVLLVDEQGTLELTAGKVSLATNNTFSDSTSYKNTAPDGTIETGIDGVTGTYTMNGSVITLTPSDGSGSYSMTIGTNSLTQVAGQFTLIYVK